MFKVCSIFHFPECNVLVLSLSRPLSALIFMAVSTLLHLSVGFSGIYFVFEEVFSDAFLVVFLVKETIKE